MTFSFDSASSVPQVSQSSNSIASEEYEPYSTEFFDAHCLDDETLCQLAEETEQEYYRKKNYAAAEVSRCQTARLQIRRQQQQQNPTPIDHAPTLTQMVDEQGDPEADPEIERLSSHMVALRRKMEKFVNQKHQELTGRRNRNLKSSIDALQHVLPASLWQAMHAVREYGNSGAHEPERLPTRQVLQQVVQKYTYEKRKYEERLR